MRIRLGNVFLALTVVACGGGGSLGDLVGYQAPVETPPVTGGTGTGASPAANGLADLVEIDQLDVLQGTSASLILEAEAVKAKKLNAPVIANRPGMMRVHARPKEKGKKVAPLTAELTISYANKPALVMNDGPRIVADFDQSDLQSTFNFQLEASAFTTDAKVSVVLRDPKKPGEEVHLLDGRPFPLGARDAGTTMRVEFVPVRYDADGSGRLAPLDPDQVESYKRALYKLYPVEKVEATVGAELPWPIAVDPRGKGWDQLLSALMKMRRSAAVESDVYYVGIFAPAPTIGQYCKGGCVLGMAPATNFWDLGLRVSMVVGFQGAAASDGTLAQELAHAMGRAHAPCGGPDYVDTDYPYAGAYIGATGFDVIKREIIDPQSRRFDFMSYCGPVWTSDYTYKAIHDRMEEVAVEKKQRDGAHIGALESSVHTVLVDATGSLSEGPEVDVGAASLASGTTLVRYEDAQGNPLGAAKVAFRPFSGPGGGMLLGAKVPSGATRAIVQGMSATPVLAPALPTPGQTVSR